MTRPKQIAGPVVKLARELAPKPEEVDVYVCPGCGVEYESDVDARSCCPPSIDPVTRYRCPECKDLYESESEAQECCEPQTYQN